MPLLQLKGPKGHKGPKGRKGQIKTCPINSLGPFGSLNSGTGTILV